MDYIVFLIGIFIGILIGIRSFLAYQSHLITKQNKKIEDLFISVKDNLIFKQRIQNYAHFSSGNYGVVYIIDKDEIAIFENEVCIAVSSSIKKSITDDIIKLIKQNFEKDINNVVDINGYKVSKEYLNKINKDISDVEKIKKSNEIKHSLDDILDKINQSGITSLTEEELEFLKNI